MLVQLDTKTVYTFMDSLVTIEKYVTEGKRLGYQMLGMMDIDNLYGAYHFLEICTKEEIQPILGLELTLFVSDYPVNLRLVALNTEGYQHLMKVSTLKMTGENQFEAFRHLLSGLAIIVPYFEDMPEAVLPVPYYIGVTADTPVRSFNQPILALNTVRYFQSTSLETLRVLHAIKDNINLREVGQLHHGQNFLSPSELSERFLNFPEALENLEKLVKDIHYEIDTSLKLPRFNPKKSAEVELMELAEAGLVKKGLTEKKYTLRLREELSVIHQMGFDDYFLIVWDLLRFGRSQGYYMGMGRGSAVGSLVAFALDITGIDPVEKNLIFERFLNLERYSMPDIDIDIPDVYRGEFIRYVRERYGSHHAAQIVTYSTFGARQVVRDVFKRFGATEYELTNITKKISFRDNLSTVYEKNASFRQIIHSKVEYQRAYQIALEIEGQPRQTSVHAAGVVMSDGDLTDYIPLKQGEEMLLTQYDAHGVESNGLLKMDFLGLRNLTLVQRMAEKVLDKYGKKIDISKINLEDKATLKLFSEGKTKGIFQFEAAGAINLLKKVKPVCFEDIVATTSLNRPGASDYISNFIMRRRSQEQIDYLDDSIRDILLPTYGIMLYQEQVMQIAQKFAGFSLGKADLLRRAMGKKNAQEMHLMQDEFVEGSKSLGYDEKKAYQIFERMEKFAGYGFNRSHAYAYSALAFQIAYFKVHYPEVFYDIMLNYSSSDYINDALNNGFSTVKLTINNIPYYDKFDKKDIYLGLKNIKGLPKDLSFWIVENRPFKSVEDFVLRLPGNYQKLTILTPLVELGLFDTFEVNRHKILKNLPRLFEFSEQLGTFFGEEVFSWEEVEDFTLSEKFNLEQSIIGVGLSPHPLLEIAKNPSRSFVSIPDLEENTRVTILVQILEKRIIRTKKTGQAMAFFKVSDTYDRLDVTVFPEVYHKFKDELDNGNFYYISGKVQKRESQLQMIAEKIQIATNERFWIQLENHNYDKEVAEILKAYPGPYPVILNYLSDKQIISPENVSVAKTEELIQKLEKFIVKTIFY